MSHRNRKPALHNEIVNGVEIANQCDPFGTGDGVYDVSYLGYLGN